MCASVEAMCCFADTVERVAKTRIFATMSGAEQVLVYDAHVATKSPNAMILPIPVRPGTGAAIELIDLSGYPGFFDVLSSMFPEVSLAFGGIEQDRADTLEVVRVGAFEASVVPTLDDISRLSRRFSFAGSSLLPWRRKRGLLSVLAERYADHAFVVYQIAPGASILHPFGLRFTSRYPYLFFPTLHVHDGDAPEQALFDHALYAQRAALYEQSAGTVWQLARGSLPWFVDPTLPVARGQIAGLYPNRDSFAGLLP